VSEPDEETGYHIPVLLGPTIDLLIGNPDGVYVDGTLGGGGHSSELLKRLGPAASVYGFDQDIEALEHSRVRFQYDSRMTLIHGNVVHLKQQLSQRGVTSIDGLLLDLGVSSHQIDEARRGFSFRADGPLDMRMNHEMRTTAADIIASSTEVELADILFTWGEERHSRRIARAIIRAAEERRIETTSELRDIVTRAVSPAHVAKTLARVFQALRIAVNDELQILEQTLRDALDMLAIGGRLVVISYHSLEDRRVKHFLRAEAASCICPPGLPVCVCGKTARVRVLTTKHREADEHEVRRNQRARSARLRAGEKIHA
jgi:16S rRNA (cytosine1402-N4)-methyltransferase